MPLTLSKNERLCSDKLMEKLFAEGNVVNAFPYRIVWMPLPDSFEDIIKVAFTVSKKKFASAVDRNLIKRRSREAFRVTKPHLLLELKDSNHKLALIYIYTNSKIIEYPKIKTAIDSSIEKILANIK